MSNGLFWAKHLGLALALVIIAGVVIVLQNNRQDTPLPEGAEPPTSLSEGMTDFYSQYRLSSRHPHPEKVGDFVMELNQSDKPLTARLKSMESLQKPVSENWSGEHKFRSFKAGSTLREAMTTYAQLEGMQVIWELDQDFIVKNQFQVDDTITGALSQIARAIDSNFPGKVRAFICPKQRSLVITDQMNDYLQKECTEADS